MPPIGGVFFLSGGVDKVSSSVYESDIGDEPPTTKRTEPMKKLLATAAIIFSISPAHAGVLDDLFGAPEPQQAPFDTALDTCLPGRKLKNVEIFDRYLSCVEKHPLASKYTTYDWAYIVRMQQTSAATHAGGDFAALRLEEKAWRIAQVQEMHRLEAQYAAQARTAAAIESIPLQQAQWAVTIHNMNSLGRGYTPQMSTTNY